MKLNSNGRILYFMRRILTLFTIILLSGCAHVTPVSSPSAPVNSWQEQKKSVQRIQSWNTTGAIGVRTAQESNSGRFNWQQRGSQNYQIDLFGPLGMGNIRIIGTPSEVILRTAKQKQYTAANAEQLLQQQLGWKLPVNNLYYWARGLPVPGIPARTEFDNSHRLTSLQQAGWQIQYLGYQSVAGVDLPAKIFMSYPRLNVRLVIKQWQLG